MEEEKFRFDVLDHLSITYIIVGIITMFGFFIKPIILGIGMAFIIGGITFKLTRIGSKYYFEFLESFDLLIISSLIAYGFGYLMKITFMASSIIFPFYLMKTAAGV